MRRMTDPDRHVTGGVDTHAEIHVASVVCSTSHQLISTGSFTATPAGYARLLQWMWGFGIVDRVGIEGTGTYGAGLARFLTAEGLEVIEVDRPDRSARRQHGKSDPVDAEAAARAVLSGRASGVPKSRDGLVEAIRVQRIVYRSAVKDRTAATNQFHAITTTAPAQIREELHQLPKQQRFTRARRWRERDGDDVVATMTRRALRELAIRIELLTDQAHRAEAELDVLTDQAAPALRDLSGVGIHTAAQLLVTAGDNPDRIRSEAAVAHLCGSRTCAASRPSRRPRARPIGTGSTATVTAPPTTRCGASRWFASPRTTEPATTSHDAPLRACPSATSCAASSATSPARSTGYSPAHQPPRPPAQRSAPYATSVASPLPTWPRRSEPARPRSHASNEVSSDVETANSVTTTGSSPSRCDTHLTPIGAS